MKRLTPAALVIALLALPALAAPYTPSIGTADRASIMDAIRKGTHSNSVMVVDYLKVTTGPDGVRLAFAEVHPASASASAPFRGWVILKRSIGERWETLWGVDYDGYGACRPLKVAYTNAVEVASRFGTSMSIFSPEFRRANMALISRRDYATCKGNIVVGDDE